MAISKLWVLKTVKDKDRALQTVDAYDDKIEETYNYDGKVANHKQINAGDFAILIDKSKILGFTKIDHILTKNSRKTIRKCPICGSSTIDKRKKLTPIYRCNKGHSFNQPSEIEVDVTKYSASFKNSFITADPINTNLSILKPFYINGYNQNMSMQLLDIKALDLFPNIKGTLANQDNYTLQPEEAESEELESYKKNESDERVLALRQIKARRGQTKFRNDLRKRYGDKCMITGSTILDILEAAHINPYRGDNDNHVTNGLLLRADIHTLFDLNLIGVQPETLEINFHDQVLREYKEYQSKKLIISINFPSKHALRNKWLLFINKKITDEHKG